MVTRVGVKAKFTGTHSWPGAPKDQPNSFLQYPHRHVFNIEVLVNVTHSDRQIEFFDMELHINQCIRDMYGEDDIKKLGARSCEIIARELWHRMDQPYKGAVVWIKIQEDDENYAVVNIEKEDHIKSQAPQKNV